MPDVEFGIDPVQHGRFSTVRAAVEVPPLGEVPWPMPL